MIHIIAATVILAAAGCSHQEDPLPTPDGIVQIPERPDKRVNLHIDLNVIRSVGNPRRTTRAYNGTRSDYDGSPESDDELLHSVRIIIIDGDGHVEHNTFWDLSSDPAVLVQGNSFPVKPNDSKTIIFIGNERYCNVTDNSTGETVNLGTYFRRLLPMYGDNRDVINIDALKNNLTIDLAENLWAGDGTEHGEELNRPLPSTSIYEGVYITDEPDQSAKFWMHRAAVKYYFEITNKSKTTEVFNGIWLENMATKEYLFYHAEFADPITGNWDKGLSQYIEGSYDPFPDAGRKEVMIPIPESNRKVAPGGTLKIGPIYLLEGPNDPVFSINGKQETGFRVLLAESGINEGGTGSGSYVMIQNSDGEVMTDLPRNHCIVVKGTFTPSAPTPIKFNYTVCAWKEYFTDIPEYN